MKEPLMKLVRAGDEYVAFGRNEAMKKLLSKPPFMRAPDPSLAKKFRQESSHSHRIEEAHGAD